MMTNILVVEDESHIRTLVATNLTHRGYQVIKAANGTEALAYLKSHPVDLVIVDLMLPDMSGWDILACLPELQDGRTIPAIVMTAYILEMELAGAKSDRVTAFLPKPFDVLDLLAALHRALGLAQAA